MNTIHSNSCSCLHGLFHLQFLSLKKTNFPRTAAFKNTFYVNQAKMKQKKKKQFINPRPIFINFISIITAY